MRVLRAGPSALVGIALLGGFAGIGRTDLAPLDDPPQFESAHVRPAALDPETQRLYVVNTPAAQLSVFDVSADPPSLVAEIPVGLEPVSVSIRSPREVWVVDKLSDDISVVDVPTAHVRATVRVGDEPTDVVFAGQPRAAFVAVSQEDAVKVLDPADLDAPARVIPIFGRRPTWLATNATGMRVFVSVLEAGNRTTVVEPEPATEPARPKMAADSTPPPPPVERIVQQDAKGRWFVAGHPLTGDVPKFSLADVDLAEIDANRRLVASTIGDIATCNFALAVSPRDGSIAMAGQEARNATPHEPALRGRFVESRLSLLRAGLLQRNICLNPSGRGPAGGSAKVDSALGLPTGVVYSADGNRIYLTSLATNRLAVFDAAGRSLARIPVLEGPTGLVEDPARGRLYVVGRFRNQVESLDTRDLHAVATVSIGADPTPDAVVNGRRHFYSGKRSRDGDLACASCHLFGDADGLAWDLGVPGGPIQSTAAHSYTGERIYFHPLKGPMVTQSLRGLADVGPLHWRGDRASIHDFSTAFHDLLGAQEPPPDSAMAALEEFLLSLRYPPNPNETLDRRAPRGDDETGNAAKGQLIFLEGRAPNGYKCDYCHLPGAGTTGQILRPGTHGSVQPLKIAQLRGGYTKLGMKREPGALSKRGFGFLHSGTACAPAEVLERDHFGFQSSDLTVRDKRDLGAFLLTFDSGLSPGVGLEVTFDGSPRDSSRIALLDTLELNARTGYIDLLARQYSDGRDRCWIRSAPDRWAGCNERTANERSTTRELLRRARHGAELTFIGAAPGDGPRLARAEPLAERKPNWVGGGN